MSTEVKVSKLPPCDIHSLEAGPRHDALYDARIPRGPWANMCQEAFDELGCSLGTGYGQKLVLAKRSPCPLSPGQVLVAGPRNRWEQMVCSEQDGHDGPCKPRMK
jgi:hypothetical protein